MNVANLTNIMKKQEMLEVGKGKYITPWQAFHHASDQMLVGVNEGIMGNLMKINGKSTFLSAPKGYLKGKST